MSAISTLSPKELPAYIAECLAQGFTQKEIAQALDVTESYISQVIAAHPELKDKNAQIQQAYEEIDTLYVEIEKEALLALKKSLNLVKNPAALLRIATGINATKRRGNFGLGLGHTEQQPQTTVQLNMPTAIISQFVFNSANQAIAIGSGENSIPLVTASTKQVEELAAKAVPVAEPRPPVHTKLNEYAENPESVTDADL